MDRSGYQGVIFTSQPIRAIGVLFSPMVSGSVGGKVCLGCILETLRCRNVDTWYGHWLGGVGVQHHSLILI